MVHSHAFLNNRTSFLLTCQSALLPFFENFPLCGIASIHKTYAFMSFLVSRGPIIYETFIEDILFLD
jgi:hypothetical protein